MKKLTLALLFFSLLNLQAITPKEYLELKTDVFQTIKDHNEIHDDEKLDELKQAYYKARHAILAKASIDDLKLAQLWTSLKEINTTSSQEGLYKTLREIEYHLITITKENEKFESLYQNWDKALTSLENKKASILSIKSSIDGSRYRKAIKALQKARK